MEDSHEEALCQVIQVLSKGQDVEAFPACTGIQTATFHPRAEAANGVTLFQGTGLLKDTYTQIQP